MAWVRQFGSRRYDEAWAEAVGPEGIYLDGFTDGRLPGTHDRGGRDAFVGLYTRKGKRVWLRQFGSNRDDFGYGLAADTSGVYVSGQTAGAFRGFTNRGGLDAFVRKLSPAGSTILDPAVRDEARRWGLRGRRGERQGGRRRRDRGGVPRPCEPRRG